MRHEGLKELVKQRRKQGGVLGRRTELMQRLGRNHLHQHIMKPKNVSGEGQGWRGKQQPDHGGPQCYAKELSLYTEGMEESLRNF